MKYLISLTAIVVAVLASCTDSNDDVVPVVKKIQGEKVGVELVLIQSDRKKFEKVDDSIISLRKMGAAGGANYALRFKDDAAFTAAIRELEHQQFAQATVGSIQSPISVKLRRAASSPIAFPSQFRSLEDVYTDALMEAESYYERVGGYEEFKEKYSCLYFPEEEGDYSAFRPVSNIVVARLVNPEGYVVIGNKIVNKRDIFTYGQLKKMGLTMPEEKSEVRIGVNTSSLEVNKLSTKYNDRRDRKLWVNVNRKADKFHDHDNVYMFFPYMEVEVCFRKKAAFGVWYNYYSSTSLTLRGELSDVKYKSGYSSHDYQWRGIPRFFSTLATVEYRGIPGTFDFYINYDATQQN